jgi:hypothetical protein
MMAIKATLCHVIAFIPTLASLYRGTVGTIEALLLISILKR